MTDLIAPIHFRELERREPGEVCQRSGCHFDRKMQCYELEIWGEVYNIFPHERRIKRSFEGNSRIHEYLFIFIIHYLLITAEMVVENEWISEKDIPGGPTFFRGPHAIPTGLITKTFQNDIEAFGHRCKFLGGKFLDMGDAAFQFQIARHIPAVVLYWQGDDDFQPEAKLLFDRSISRHLASDVIYALAVEMCARIGGSQ